MARPTVAALLLGLSLGGCSSAKDGGEDGLAASASTTDLQGTSSSTSNPDTWNGTDPCLQPTYGGPCSDSSGWPSETTSGTDTDADTDPSTSVAATDTDTETDVGTTIATDTDTDPGSGTDPTGAADTDG